MVEKKNPEDLEEDEEFDDEDFEDEDDEDFDEDYEEPETPDDGEKESKVKELVMNSKKLRGWKLIKYISYVNKITTKEARDSFNFVFNAIQKALEEDRKVFTPIGKIELARLKPKKTKVGFTGKEINLPERITVKLRVNGKFKKHLNELKK
ncbi:HU family DNA-binding protein [Desulfurella sp.]|uniref:HU family DNA-binding protein n=1 Tax=Desulfurella sp. TaxID=1962857 RepID=UPI0025C26F79|nr:HU family DNA-binding protein [Desulfurella sp.]